MKGLIVFTYFIATLDLKYIECHNLYGYYVRGKLWKTPSSLLTIFIWLVGKTLLKLVVHIVNKFFLNLNHNL